MYIISYDSELPLQNFFSKMGEHSYSLYLFNSFYVYLILIGLGIYNYIHVIMTVLLFPLFYYFCVIAEKGFSRKNLIKEVKAWGHA